MLCDHIDVVDLFASDEIQSALSSDGVLDPEWICPVCGRAYDSTDSLEVDGFVLNILREAPASVTSVVVSPSGDWVASLVSQGNLLKRKHREFAEPVKEVVVDLDEPEAEEEQQTFPKRPRNADDEEQHEDLSLKTGVEEVVDLDD